MFLHHKNKEKKENSNVKAVTMVDPAIGWFKITQYDDKKAISIRNWVKTTRLTRYPIPMKITYDPGL